RRMVLAFPIATIYEKSTYFLFYINPATRLFEFALGIALARLSASSVTDPNGTLAEVLAAGGALGTLLLIMFAPIPAAFALSIAAVPASALVILVFARGSGSLSSFLSHRWFIALGEASFMLYMIHVLVR